MNDVLRQAEFERAMSEQREFMRGLIEPVAKVAVDNDKAIAVLQTDHENLSEKVDEQRRYQKAWDIINSAGAIIAGVIAGISGQK